MIFLVLPCNFITGWGVCATNLARELSKKTQIRYVSTELESINDQQSLMDSTYFRSLLFKDYDFLSKQKHYPVIEAVHHDLLEYMGKFSGSKKIGIVFCDRKIPQINLANAKNYDVLVAGSTWCQNLLLQQNIESKVILQGVDPLLFNCSRSEKQVWRDDFMVFIGGKYEHRKGQDVALKAYKLFQDKYPDSRLVCCWDNPYNKNTGVDELYKLNIDLNRVICLPNLPNSCMASVYQNTDVGIFASRCEAGTNLVLMEYIACGKTAIATVGTGQSDLINSKTGLPLNKSQVCKIIDNGEFLANWEEPDCNSVFENLEWAYHNPEKTKQLGSNAADMMKKYSWEYMASQIYELCVT